MLTIMSDATQAVQSAIQSASPSSSDLDLSPLPSSRPLPVYPTSNLLPVLNDDRAVAGLLEMLLRHARLTPNDAAKQLGIHPSSVKCYLAGRRSRPSIQWFVRFVNLCGGVVRIEFPAAK